jgi:hypothetical protein
MPFAMGRAGLREKKRQETTCACSKRKILSGH